MNIFDQKHFDADNSMFNHKISGLIYYTRSLNKAQIRCNEIKQFIYVPTVAVLAQIIPFSELFRTEVIMVAYNLNARDRKINTGQKKTRQNLNLETMLCSINP